MKFRRRDPFLADDPLVEAIFDIVFGIALLGLPPAILFSVTKEMFFSKPWSPTDLIPAYGHFLALLWMLFVVRWSQIERKRLAKIPERSVEQAYQHRALEDQRGGVRLVVWGTLAGSLAAMAAGWILPHFL